MTYVQMMARAAIVTATAALLLTGTGSGRAVGANQSRVLWQGPLFAGTAVMWGEESGGTGALHRWLRAQGDRTVYSSDSLALGRPFAASRTLLTFERGYPSCRPQPNLVCPQATDAVVGPVAGPYRTLVPARTCFLPTLGTALALDRGAAAYLKVDCRRELVRVVARDVAGGGKPVVLREAPIASGCCRDVAIAGRYVAWSEGGDVVVFDWLAGRSAYRAHIALGGTSVDLGFALQRDGKLAVAFRPVEFGRSGATTIGWLSPSAPRLHALPLRGADTRIRLAADRIAFVRSLTSTMRALVVTDLSGRALETVATFASPTRLRSGFDFDGQRITWASDRVTSTREDCPPPGQGRPCVLRESGVTTIWLRGSPTRSPAAVARLTFVDTVGHPG